MDGETNWAFEGAQGLGQADDLRRMADRLGLEPHMLVVEMGYDDDVDELLRRALIERVGDLRRDTDGTGDAVLLWYRDGDGDLSELLAAAVNILGDDGVVWLMTPKINQGRQVTRSEISEAAATTDLFRTAVADAASGWTAYRLVLLGRPVPDRGRAAQLNPGGRPSPPSWLVTAINAVIDPYRARPVTVTANAFVAGHSGYDPADPAAALDVELSSALYLDTDDEEKIAAVLSALQLVVGLAGYDEGHDVLVQRGSVFRRARHLLKRGVTSRELTTRLIKLERAAELTYLDGKQAEVDGAGRRDHGGLSPGTSRATTPERG